MACRGKEEAVLLERSAKSMAIYSCMITYILWFDVTGLQELIELGSEFTGMILPDRAVLVGQPVLLLGQPIRLVGASLRDEVYLETSPLENVEWMKCLGDKEPCLLAVWIEGSMGGRYSD
jgi:hypothetical protein